MKSYDKALEHLEHATQRSFEANLAANYRDRCWRCLGKAGSGPSGVCEACRAVLLADLPPEEPESADSEPDYADSASLSPNPGNLTAYEAFLTLSSEFGQLELGVVRDSPEITPETTVRREDFGWFVIIDDISGTEGRPGDFADVSIGYPMIIQTGTRWAGTDLYEAILAQEDILPVFEAPRGPITFLEPPEEPS